MNRIKIGLLLLVLALAGLLVQVGCGGGDGEEIILPPVPPADGDGQFGDPDEPVIVPLPNNPFIVPGGYQNVRGVAVSQNFVYVADLTALYAFDKVGNLRNVAGSPGNSTIQGVAVFPPAPDVDIESSVDYVFSGFPAIVHDPVGGYGYVTIYGPDLDTAVTIEDGTAPDGAKFISLPGAQMDPPNDESEFLCVRTFDIAIDRFGSIMVTADVDVKFTDPFPDFPSALQALNQYRSFTIEEGGSIDDDDGVSFGVPCFHTGLGDATGALATIAFDGYFPLNRPDTAFTWYTGDFNLLRDYVGVSTMTLNTNAVIPFYVPGGTVNNDFGYSRVIGETAGNNPGSFNKIAPRDPDGNLEDTDLTNGGPSGMFVDPLTDTLYVCDPGNRRIQLFERGTGEFIRQLGDGTRGTSGNSFLAPSNVCIDFERTIYVGDVDGLRLLREKLPDRVFGNVGGTVRRLDNGNVLEGATVTLGNELGVLAVRTSNINGQYFIDNLLVNTYNMIASKFNYDSDSAVIQVIADTTVEVNFNLNPRTPSIVGAYTGTVIDKFSNLPISDVLISIVGTSLTTHTDDAGSFALTNIAPGVYQVEFSHPDFGTLTREIQIVEGNVTSDPLIELDPL